MKIAGYQLEQTIAHGGLKPIYLITGDDAYLRYEALNYIQSTAKQLDFSEKTKWTAHLEDENDTLADLLLTSPLFQTKQLIELQFNDKFPTNRQQQILEAACQNTAPDKLIVLQCKKLDAKSQHAGWVKAIDRIGCIVTIWPLTLEQLKAYIVAHAKKYRLSINSDATNLLAEYAEGNVTLAAQTLEKAHLLNEQPVSKRLIEELVTHDNHYNIFDLGDALISGNIARMLTILENLQATGTEPTLVLWSLTREVRVLIDCLTQLNIDNDLQPIFKKHAILSKKQDIIRRHLKQHSLLTCHQWLQHAYLIDEKIKRFFISDAWRELQIFCLRAT